LKVSVTDHERIREVIGIARQAASRGDNPFGALLVGADGSTLASAGNSQSTDGQVLAHAEMNLLHQAVKEHPPEILGGATLYTSAEPCAMCTGALFWSGVGRLVFGLSNRRLHEIHGANARQLAIGSTEVLKGAGRVVEVIGPVLEDEAARLFGP
jgi:tRNA(Arg) A34 adenosine deaminase TadA